MNQPKRNIAELIVLVPDPSVFLWSIRADGCRPISDSLALASREYDHLTVSRLSSLSLDMGTIPRGSSSPKSRRIKTLYPEDPPHTPSSSSRLIGGTDEIARAEAIARQRMGAFMSYKDQDFSDSDGEEDVEGMFEVEEEEDYPGSSRPDDVPFGGRRGEGTGERVDGVGEDDERFAEGNSDDEGGGDGDEGGRPSEGLEERMVVG